MTDPKPCRHQFFEIKKLSAYKDRTPTPRIDKEGVLVGCVLCGQLRQIWEDGTIRVKSQKNDTTASNTTI